MMQRVLNARYQLARISSALEDALGSFQAPPVDFTSQNKQDPPPASAMSKAYSRFTERLNQPLTTTMYIAGPHMAPALNKAAMKNKDAVELLVVRHLPRPSSRTVLVGDVVAFTSPLGPPDATHVMVRRVAALEGEEMVTPSGRDEEDAYTIPPGHFWVLADNPTLRPPAVIDSRTFGHIPLANIVGRVIYAASSKADHGPVINHPNHEDEDAAVIEAEVDVEELFDDGDGDKE